MSRSHMSHSFAQVPSADIPRSTFSRPYDYKTTFNSGFLVPVYVDEVLPGDTFSVKMTAFARLSTPLVPFMDNLFLDSHFFFVPNRLIWENFKKFMGEQRNPADSTSYLVPQQVSPSTGVPATTGYLVGSLQDYMGIPTNIPGLSHSALFTRAYNLIWNEWFRDENLQNSVPTPMGDGPDTVTDFILLRRGKRHDYFTSALPWPQKGAAVSIPLTGNAPIIMNPANSNPILKNASTNAVLTAAPSLLGQTTTGFLTTNTSILTKIDPNGSLLADLSAVNAATINALRQAFQVQKFLERDARSGTRYTEILQSHFGVTSPDSRLQRPEYLGGSSTPVNINPIAQTSANAAQPTPQGNLAAMGTVHAHSGHSFSQSFTEHGVIIGLVSVRADLTYQQGLDRMWSRKTKYDFYWPVLSHLGEQTVLNKELYAVGSANPTQDEAVFGYQERWAEYRYKPSKITGMMRSSFPQTLDMWHLAQNFTALPTLNSTFIEENPPVARVSAVPSYPQFLFDGFFNIKCARPMPVYSVPGLIDHF